MRRNKWHLFLASQLILASVVSLLLALHGADNSGIRRFFLIENSLSSNSGNGSMTGISSLYTVNFHGQNPWIWGLVLISEGNSFKPLFLAPVLRNVSLLDVVEPGPHGWIHSTHTVWEQEGWVLIEPAGPVLPREELVFTHLIRAGYTASRVIYFSPELPSLILWPIERGVSLLYVFALGNHVVYYHFIGDKLIRKLTKAPGIKANAVSINGNKHGTLLGILGSPLTTVKQRKCLSIGSTRSNNRSSLEAASILALYPHTKIDIKIDSTSVYSGSPGKALIIRVVAQGVHQLCIESDRPVLLSVVHSKPLKEEHETSVLDLKAAIDIRKRAKWVLAPLLCSSEYYIELNSFQEPFSCSYSGHGIIYIGGGKGCNKWIVLESLRTGYPLLTISRKQHGYSYVSIRLGNYTISSSARGPLLRLAHCLEILNNAHIYSLFYNFYMLYTQFHPLLAGMQFKASSAFSIKAQVSGVSNIEWFYGPDYSWSHIGIWRYDTYEILGGMLMYASPLLLLPEPEPIICAIVNPSSTKHFVSLLQAMAMPIQSFWGDDNEACYQIWPLPLPSLVGFSVSAGNIGTRVNLSIIANLSKKCYSKLYMLITIDNKESMINISLDDDPECVKKS